MDRDKWELYAYLKISAYVSRNKPDFDIVKFTMNSRHQAQEYNFISSLFIIQRQKHRISL